MKQYIQPTLEVTVVDTPEICTASIEVPGGNGSWDDEEESASSDPTDAPTV